MFTWFQWEHHRRPITSWASLKRLILQRFCESPIGSISKELLSINQTTKVKEYRMWKMLAARVPDVPEYILEGSFMRRLKDEIRAVIHVLQLIGLGHIMDTAQRVEEGHQLFSSSPFSRPSSQKMNQGQSAQIQTALGPVIARTQQPSYTASSSMTSHPQSHTASPACGAGQ